MTGTRRTLRWLLLAGFCFFWHQLFLKLASYPASPIDCPELRGMLISSKTFQFYALLSAFVLTGFFINRREATLFAMCVLIPFGLFAGSLFLHHELTARSTDLVGDRAGRFAHDHPDVNTASLAIAGEILEGSHAAFYVDDPAAQIIALKEKEVLTTDRLNKNVEWLLLIGDHPSRLPRAETVLREGYSLIRLGR